MIEEIDDVEAVMERGRRSFGIGRWAQALEAFEEVLAAEAGGAEARAMAGRCRLRLGDGRQALVDLKAALEESEEPEAIWWVELGEAYISQEEIDSASDSFQAAMELDSRQAEAFAGMGVVYMRKRAYKMAEAALERALAIEYSLAVVHNNLAVVHCYLGNFERAAEELDIARNLGHPIDPSFRELLNKQLIERKRAR